MYKVIKKAGKRVKAYRLGEAHEVLTRLIEEGKIVPLGNDTYEIMSLEVANAGSGKGEIAHAGDYVKIYPEGYPYPNKSKYFKENHKWISDDEYELIPKPLYAWDSSEPMCEEMEFLIKNKGLVINPDNPQKYYSASLWGTMEGAPEDAVVVFFSITRDEDGKIVDMDYNFVIREAFEKFFDLYEG